MMKFTAAGDAIIQRRIQEGYVGFSELTPFINQGDARFFNLETTLNYEGECYGNQFSGGTYIRCNPEVARDVLDFGFNMTTFNNNHVMDFAHDGLLKTLENVNNMEIVHGGVGRNLGEASAPAYLDTKNGRVALIAINTSFNPACMAGEASKRIPIVQSGNYSLGVNLLLELVGRAAATLGPEYDIEVTEMHHRHKKDAPSGTALMLAKAAAAGRGVDFGKVAVYGREGETGERPAGEIAVHALRGGSVIGDHTVMFAGDVERVEITHRAQGREAFAAGALKALEWAKGRAPGMYTMRDVLGFSSAEIG